MSALFPRCYIRNHSQPRGLSKTIMHSACGSAGRRGFSRDSSCPLHSVSAGSVPCLGLESLEGCSLPHLDRKLSPLVPAKAGAPGASHSRFSSMWPLQHSGIRAGTFEDTGPGLQRCISPKTAPDASCPSFPNSALETRQYHSTMFEAATKVHPLSRREEMLFSTF